MAKEEIHSIPKTKNYQTNNAPGQCSYAVRGRFEMQTNNERITIEKRTAKPVCNRANQKLTEHKAKVRDLSALVRLLAILRRIEGKTQDSDAVTVYFRAYTF